MSDMGRIDEGGIVIWFGSRERFQPSAPRRRFFCAIVSIGALCFIADIAHFLDTTFRDWLTMLVTATAVIMPALNF